MNYISPDSIKATDEQFSEDDLEEFARWYSEEEETCRYCGKQVGDSSELGCPYCDSRVWDGAES